MNFFILKNTMQHMVTIITRDYLCFVFGPGLMPQFSAATRHKKCFNLPSELPALAKTPKTEGAMKYVSPINRQPALVSMNLSTLHYGRHRFNYFILTSLLIATGTFALLL
eukprot:TRINITY_DN4544_c0_g3_i1.p1 TRINITY_DN4544_c0_g3~~TRINITY_DN4544_c0_g3_i1.p1  ORF type:complete len:110 (-),score=22.15 TRINITY_DN4544_c0_g3_i1:77-406(-)